MGRKKAEKRAITFYKVAFGLVPTYNVIVHPEVIKQCIIQQINLRDQLPSVMTDNALPCTTKCIVQYLRSTEETDHLGAAVMARKFKMIACSHQKVKALDGGNRAKDDKEETETAHLLSPDACITDVLENLRPVLTHSVAVVTSVTCPAKISKERFYNVPFVLLKSSPFMLVLQAPAEKALKVAKKNEKKSREMPEHEKNQLAKESEVEIPLPQYAGKKRKRKQPNPLSTLKKKQKTSDKTTASGEKGQERTKRKTRRRKKLKKSLASQIDE